MFNRFLFHFQTIFDRFYKENLEADVTEYKLTNIAAITLSISSAEAIFFQFKNRRSNVQILPIQFWVFDFTGFFHLFVAHS